MALRINFNFESASTHTSLVQNEREMNKSLLRLSTGLRILNASDDAAGLFIADQLSVVATGYREGNRNIQTGLSALRIAENSAGQIFDRLNQIYARASRAANDVNDPNARGALQQEIANLVDAIQKIGTDTEYNGIRLLDGTFQNKYIHYGPRNNQVVNVTINDIRAQSLGAHLIEGNGSVASNTGAFNSSNFANYVYSSTQTASIYGQSFVITANNSGTHIIDASVAANDINNNSELRSRGVSAFAKNESTAATYTALATSTTDITNVSLTFFVGDKRFNFSTTDASISLNDLVGLINQHASAAGANLQASATPDGKLKLTTTNGETIAVQMDITTSGTATANLSQIIEGASDQTAGAAGSFTASAVKVGKLTVAGMDAVSMDLPTTGSATALGLSSDPANSTFYSLYAINVSTNAGAEKAMMIVSKALQKVDTVRSNIGAVMNNLQSIYDAQKVALDNTQEAENIIRNTDYAEEMTNFTRLQIKMQSGMAMLAQANQLPQLVLQLLR